MLDCRCQPGTFFGQGWIGLSLCTQAHAVQHLTEGPAGPGNESDSSLPCPLGHSLSLFLLVMVALS
jgi:hypothetical protein